MNLVSFKQKVEFLQLYLFFYVRFLLDCSIIVIGWVWLGCKCNYIMLGNWNNSGVSVVMIQVSFDGWFCSNVVYFVSNPNTTAIRHMTLKYFSFNDGKMSALLL